MPYLSKGPRWIPPFLLRLVWPCLVLLCLAIIILIRQYGPTRSGANAANVNLDAVNVNLNTLDSYPGAVSYPNLAPFNVTQASANNSVASREDASDTSERRITTQEKRQASVSPAANAYGSSNTDQANADQANIDEDSQIHFLRVSAIAQAQSTEVSKRSLIIPAGWYVGDTEMIQRQGRVRSYQKDNKIFLEAHALPSSTQSNHALAVLKIELKRIAE